MIRGRAAEARGRACNLDELSKQNLERHLNKLTKAAGTFHAKSALLLSLSRIIEATIMPKILAPIITLNFLLHLAGQNPSTMSIVLDAIPHVLDMSWRSRLFAIGILFHVHDRVRKGC